jgi:hypothetical protein
MLVEFHGDASSGLEQQESDLVRGASLGVFFVHTRPGSPRWRGRFDAFPMRKKGIDARSAAAENAASAGLERS